VDNIRSEKKRAAELAIANAELLFQNEEKEKRAAELVVANAELAFQNEEKAKRAAELLIANAELLFQNKEKEKRAAELVVANTELRSQNEEKEKRAAELVIANAKLAFQNEEKEKRAAELVIANAERVFQNQEKEKLFTALVIANAERAFQNEEKAKRAAELVIANAERVSQNEEKEKRAAELVIANAERVLQNGERENLFAKLVIANAERVLQNEEKAKLAAELVIANAELAFQNEEKEKRAAELLQAQKMESIGHLTGGIAHDFNNMLGAILGYAEMLTMAGPDKVPLCERDQKYIRQIQSAGNRAQQLIAQMLMFSRADIELDTGNTTITLLQPLIKEVLGLLRATIPSTIEINNHNNDDSLQVNIQPIHLHQILMNLTINAWQAMGEYGSIEVNTARETSSGVCTSCHQSYSGDYVNLSVSNSGGGISPHVVDKMFDPFFTTKGPTEGSGMGLSVVHGIVHGQGGHILVQSSAEHGTTFNILLPSVSSQQTPPEIANTTSIGNIKGLRIMVVDDESTLAAMLQDYLTTYGAEVTVFTDPVLAWEAFLQIGDIIDLVITDETMPRISGMLLAEKLLALKPSLPIVLCTGYSEQATAESAAKIGIAGFFHKPVRMNELLVKIQLLCQS
jgi:signal transduction histidine kinase/CheY-like chemotaxis protein